MRRSEYTFALAGLLLTGVLVGCGVVGPPIPPEDVGVAATIARQKKMPARQGSDQQPRTETTLPVEEPPPGPVGQDEELPPLRPVGTR